MIRTDGYDPNDPRDNPPDTAEDHAVAIVEAIERRFVRLMTDNAEARAALAETIRAALASVRAPAWVPADNAMRQAAAAIEIEAIALREHTEIVSLLRGAGHSRAADIVEAFRGPTGLMSERTAIVMWLRKQIGADSKLADAIERGEHLRIRNPPRPSR